MVGVGGEAAARGLSEWAGGAAARRSGDVRLDHRRNVVELAGIPGDDPAAGAVADDDHGRVLRVARRCCPRAVTARRDPVSAGLHVADHVMQHRTMSLGGQGVTAAGMIEVAALRVTQPVVGEDNVAGARQCPGD